MFNFASKTFKLSVPGNGVKRFIIITFSCLSADPQEN